MVSPHVEIMDPTKVASTFPQLGSPNINRQNMIITLFDMLQTDTQVVVVEGPDGIGKSTLLAQFAMQYPEHTFSMFIRSSSRWAYDSGMLTRDLCDQIGCVLSREDGRTCKDLDPVQLLGARIFELQRQANYERSTYYFVVDGLNDIPEEDSHEREMILKLLPFGLPRFRFILSGPVDRLKRRSPKIADINSFRLPGFTFEETREFFKGLLEDRNTLETIHTVSKMVPGNLASVRRLLRAGVEVDQLLQELPERLPDLFELEWRVVETADDWLREALAILAFDRRQHSVETLAQLCKRDPIELEMKLASCNFVVCRDGGREVGFVCEVFKSFAASRLANLRRSVLDVIITELLSRPECADALTHLPDFLHQAERYEDLLNYLSPKNIGSLIDCGDSWIPLQQKVDLGVDTAFRMRRDGDLLRFGLQRATIASMGGFGPYRSEMEAYVALGDFPAAYALVQQMITKEDRLHLLSVLARSKKAKSLPIEVELSDQIQQLYRTLDRSSLAERGVDIATDLLFSHPELAIELVQECIGQEGSEDKLDLALARLSFNAFVQNKGAPGMESTYQALSAKVRDPEVKQFVDTVSLFFGGYSAEAVIAEVEKWENASDRIFALRSWASANLKRTDAAEVVEYALNTILKSTTYAANAKVYKELALPLVHLPDANSVKTIIGRFDGLKGPIECAGPTEEYIKLQTILSEAEARFDKQAAIDRLEDLFFYVDAISEPTIKLASLAILAGVLRKIDPDKQYEPKRGIHTAVVEGLQSVVDDILSRTASHYEAVRSAIAALANSNTKIALEVVAKLNTFPRREAGLVKFVSAIAASAPSEESFDAIAKAYGQLKSITMRAQATIEILRGLLTQKKEMAPFIAQVAAIQEWVKDIPDAEERCRALYMLLELLIEHQKTILSSSLFDSLSLMLESAWDAMDLGWSKIDVGFKIVALMAESFPTISRHFLSRTEQVRKEIILDCHDTAIGYITCVRLTIRCFVGLMKRRLYSDDDLDALQDLISRIPAVAIRTLVWSELAIKFYLEEDIKNCRKIVFEKVRPALESNVIQDTAALWDVTTAVAPALYCAHDFSAKQLLDKLPQPYRDDAYANICSFLITKQSPTESYDPQNKPSRQITYEDFLDIYQVLERFESDSVIYYHLELLVDGLAKYIRREFNNSQIADVLHRLSGLIACKFPNPNYISHDGFKILAEAQLARLDRNKNVWEDLASRARVIPNIADKAFVLMGIGAAMPSRDASKAALLLEEAKTLIPEISTHDDRCDRYETLATYSADFNKRISKECLTLAWNETMPLDSTQLPKARKRIIDFAHRLDPEFAAGLASEMNDDPGREFARTQAKQRLETLKLRERVATGEDEGLTANQSTKQKVELAKMLLAGLNSNRINTVHIDLTRQFVKQASQMKMQDAYTVLSWVVENAVRRYSNTDQASGFLRPLYDAARLSSELAFRLAARIRSTSEIGLSVARTTGASRNGLIKTGEREKALTFLKEWAATVSGFIKITDPYFGLEELELVKLIRSVNAKIPIFILTSRKHQKDTAVQQPWDETYQSHWRLAISDFDPGDVTIVVVGEDSSGQHPIHDRWWLSERGGLRIGTSANSLGLWKMSEVSMILETETAFKLAEVERYLAGSISEVGLKRVKYLSFNL